MLLDGLALLLAVALDLLFPEPPAPVHPVVWMGKVISLLERVSPKSGKAKQLLAGSAIAVAVPALFGGLAWLAAMGLGMLGPAAYVLGTAALLRTTFTVHGLTKAALRTYHFMAQGDIQGARASLRSLVSRDTRSLTPPLTAAAAIESAAENTTDSFFAPWLAFALFGLPGAFAYRAVNTLDSMVGYHGRYEYLGKVPARLDDTLNLLPARLGALLLLFAGGLRGLAVRQGWRVTLRDHKKTESPNAGWTMSAMAGLMGVALEKQGHYRLGEGLREPVGEDISCAVGVVRLAAALGMAVTAGLLAARLFL
ncbi:MAG: cobalamin biosynthesis protein CobD [Chloroflexi bacterium]|nr:cobalamin biosynthesis protein CobD [Chloroflexota bacterium]